VTSDYVFETFQYRLSDTSKATMARIEKHGKNKLGPGGYSKLVARIVGTKK